MSSHVLCKVQVLPRRVTFFRAVMPRICVASCEDEFACVQACIHEAVMKQLWEEILLNTLLGKKYH